MCTYGIDIILNQLWIYVVLQSQRPNSSSGPGPQITGWVNSSTWFDSLSEHLLGVPVPHVCTCWAKRAELVVTMDQWLNRGNHKRYMEWMYPEIPTVWGSGASSISPCVGFTSKGGIWTKHRKWQTKISWFIKQCTCMSYPGFSL